MLRFTRVEDSVQLQLPPKEHPLSSDLLKGFGLAVLFHLLFLTLFRVVSPLPPADLSVLVPNAVEVDLGQKMVTHVMPPPSPFEKKQAPALYELAPSAVCSIERYHEFSCSAPDFSELEKLEYCPMEVNFDYN